MFSVLTSLLLCNVLKLHKSSGWVYPVSTVQIYYQYALIQIALTFWLSWKPKRVFSEDDRNVETSHILWFNLWLKPVVRGNKQNVWSLRWNGIVQKAGPHFSNLMKLNQLVFFLTGGSTLWSGVKKLQQELHILPWTAVQSVTAEVSWLLSFLRGGSL